MIHPAAYGKVLKWGGIKCLLCPAECTLDEGKTGICQSRFNRAGKLVTDNYGEAVTLAVDPIEKKPLYHFHPGSQILSTGPNCCNLGCSFCQNWQISQERVPTRYHSPEQLVAIAGDEKSIGIAFTYTEPLIWFEYILDTAPLAHAAGLKVVLVSNGYINLEPLKELLPHVDAFNIDLKGMTERFYLRMCKGKLAPVMENIRLIGKSMAHLEITNLVIPGENDSDADFEALATFVASVSDRIPLHFSAYHPDYKMQIPATPKEALLRGAAIARRYLKYVYLGNVAADEGNNTSCPSCGHLQVERSGYRAMMRGLSGSRCGGCGAESDIHI